MEKEEASDPTQGYRSRYALGSQVPGAPTPWEPQGVPNQKAPGSPRSKASSAQGRKWEILSTVATYDTYAPKESRHFRQASCAELFRFPLPFPRLGPVGWSRPPQIGPNKLQSARKSCMNTPATQRQECHGKVQDSQP